MSKPAWLNKKIRWKASDEVLQLMRRSSLHTVCEEAHCPNISECFARHTATFLILGNTCTRNCSFCAVSHGVPPPVDPAEPARVAGAIKTMAIRYAVITSVTRDDLADGGAAAFAEVIRRAGTEGGAEKIEVLIPDLQGDIDALRTVLEAAPDVLGHNVETVPRLYALVRKQADYQRSLLVLANALKINPKQRTKSGLMVGLGETEKEVLQVMRDLAAVGCASLSIGQYLAPSKHHYPVQEYIRPDMFEHYRKKALEMGFQAVMSGPYVRSSYFAESY